MSNNFTIHTLGCGSAKPTPAHQPSSTVVDHRGRLFMIDCGEGAQRTFQYHRLKPTRLGHIFLTHLHGDHVFGLPGFVGTMGLQQEGGAVTIHTFKEGERILKEILDYFSPHLPFELKFNILDPNKEEVAYEDHALTVRTIPLRHRVPTVGYVFEEKEGLRHIKREMTDFHGVPVSMLNKIKGGADFVKPDGSIVPNEILTSSPTPARSYAHISDTAYFPELAAKIGPVDLLLHETTYLDSHKADAAERGHSTAKQAATVARDAGAKVLLTTHYSSRYYKDESGFVAEAKEIFPGEVLLNNERLVYDIKP
ncbi:MAG: ribonuclease Z [Muribaculaceae bacterium]|nr:ribonuclease Z [Muribaculaceae bacterium]